MPRLTRHDQAEPHTSTPRRHDLGVLRTDEFFFDIARYRNGMTFTRERRGTS